MKEMSSGSGEISRNNGAEQLSDTAVDMTKQTEVLGGWWGSLSWNRSKY